MHHAPPRRNRGRLPLGLGALAGVLWLAQPWWRPALVPAAPYRAPVIAVLIEDPQRTEAALEAWQRQPQAKLWLLGAASLQAAAAEQLRRRGLPAASMAEPLRLEAGRNTVEQLQALAVALRSRPPRQLLLITDAAHLPRAQAIARILLGPAGTRVRGVASFSTAELNAARAGRPIALPPESPWRRRRDQLRAQLCRTPLGCLPS